jgi:uncharacterized membrane protein YfcA
LLLFKINRDNLCKEKLLDGIYWLFSSIIIGLSLGLIGGGGSILAVPILVYLFKINPEQPPLLLIVGFTAMIGSFSHHKLGNLKIKSALVFAILYFIATSQKNYATATS